MFFFIVLAPCICPKSTVFCKMPFGEKNECYLRRSDQVGEINLAAAWPESLLVDWRTTRARYPTVYERRSCPR